LHLDIDPKTQEFLEKLLQEFEGTNYLLGRLIFPKNSDISEIVVKGQQQPEKYLLAYNLCDGNNTVTEIAQKSGLDKSNLNKVLTNWAVFGIIYEVDKSGGKYYKNLRKIEYQKPKEPPKNSKKASVNNNQSTGQSPKADSQKVGIDIEKEG